MADDIPDRALDALEAGGMRGARFNFNLTPAPSMAALAALAPRLAERGWLMQIGMRSPRLMEEAATLNRLPGTLVLEHCAGISWPGRRRMASPCWGPRSGRWPS